MSKRSPRRLTTCSELFEFAKKSRGFLCGFLIRLWSISSVAIGTDSANTRRADADAAPLPLAPAFDITLAAGSIPIRIMVLANDDATFTTFAPATA